MGKDKRLTLVFLVLGILIASILASSSFHDDATGSVIRSSSRTTLPSSSVSPSQEIQEIISTSEASTNFLESTNENSNRRASTAVVPEITNQNMPDSISLVPEYKNQERSQKKIVYTKGNLIVQSKEPLSFAEKSGYILSSQNSLNELNRKYAVSEIVELFPAIEDQSLRNTYLFVFNEEKSVTEAVADYGQDSNILYVEPNFLAETNARKVVQPAPVPPNDPFYSQQWHLPKIDSLNAWVSITTPSSVPVIAIIDTGVQWSHPDLSANIWNNTGEIPNNNFDDDQNGFIDDVRGWDFVETTYPSCHSGEDCTLEDNNPNDFHGHGTHVAGIAGAVTNNNLGIAGVCANFCKIMPVRAGFSFSNWDAGLELDDIVQSIIYAADNGADVISMSFGGTPSILEQNAINYAYNRGVVLVAAAGNLGQNTYRIEGYPAGDPKVIAVGATDQNDVPASFSNYGPWVDIAAPGVLVQSTVASTSQWSNPAYVKTCISPTECYQLSSGTSMSAPIISGIIGLILAKNNSMTQDEVLSIIHSSTKAIAQGQKYVGTGRIDAFNATAHASSPIIAALSDQLGDSVNGNLPFSIIGTTSGQNFVSYKVEIGFGTYPTNWLVVQPDTFTPVTNGILANLNPAILNLLPGRYTLKLTVRDTNGRTWEDTTYFLVDPTMFSWSTNPNKEFTDSRLVAFDIDGDSNKEIFYNSVELFSGNNLFYGIDHSGSPLAGWPKNTGYLYEGFIDSNPFLTFPAIGNIDADSAIEVSFNVPYSPYVGKYVYETNGNLQSGWPISYSGNIPSYSKISPSVLENIDGGSDKEIIFVKDGHYSQAFINICWPYLRNSVHIHKQDGTPLPGWPKSFDCSVNPVAVGDVDNNGDMEVVISTIASYNGAQFIGQLNVFNDDGTLLTGWPQSTSAAMLSPPVLADMDQNDGGRLEIIQAGTDGRLYVFHDNGTIVTGWPQTLGTGFGLNFPAIADMDNNGDLEIVIIADNNQIYVLNHDGTILPGWPKWNYWHSFPLIADLDGNGFKEIITNTWATSFGSPEIYVYKYDGTMFNSFPKFTSHPLSLLVDDINGNGLIDLFGIDYLGNTYLWEFTGQATPQNLPWPMTRHDAQNTGKY